jgi:hypothetical protein
MNVMSFFAITANIQIYATPHPKKDSGFSYLFCLYVSKLFSIKYPSGKPFSGYFSLQKSGVLHWDVGPFPILNVEVFSLTRC